MKGPVWERRVIEAAIAASMDALPERLTAEEMASAAEISVWALRYAFERAHHTSPTAHVQDLCVRGARHELEKASPGDTVIAIARRWGFLAHDGVFAERYVAIYHEHASETLKRARATRTHSVQTAVAPPPDDHIGCLECRRVMRRLAHHLKSVHAMSTDAYRQRWQLPPDYPLVCGELSRASAERARKLGIGARGVRLRKTWKTEKDAESDERIDGTQLPTLMLVAKAEELVLAALPARLTDRYLARRLGIGRRALRRAFVDERNLTPQAAIRQLRLREARRLLFTDATLTPRMVARHCGFNYDVRFRHELEACLKAAEPPPRTIACHSMSEPVSVSTFALAYDDDGVRRRL